MNDGNEAKIDMSQIEDLEGMIGTISGRCGAHGWPLVAGVLFAATHAIKLMRARIAELEARLTAPPAVLEAPPAEVSAPQAKQTGGHRHSYDLVGVCKLDGCGALSRGAKAARDAAALAVATAPPAGGGSSS